MAYYSNSQILVTVKSKDLLFLPLRDITDHQGTVEAATMAISHVLARKEKHTQTEEFEEHCVYYFATIYKGVGKV